MEEQFKKLKQEYIRTSIPPYLKTEGWQNLSTKLDSQKHSPFLLFFPKTAFALAALLLFVTTAAAKASKNAVPQSTLYPVKLAAENVVAKVTGDDSQIIENRAQEIIDISENDDIKLEEAVKRYEKTVDKSKQQSKNEEEKKDLEEVLEEQRKRFKEAKRENSKNRHLDDAIEKTNRAYDEIKIEESNNDDDHEDD